MKKLFSFSCVKEKKIFFTAIKVIAIYLLARTPKQDAFIILSSVLWFLMILLDLCMYYKEKDWEYDE